MTDTPRDNPPVKRDEPPIERRGERREERREDRREVRRRPSAVRRLFTALMIYAVLIMSGALLAVVSAYLMRKFGF